MGLKHSAKQIDPKNYSIKDRYIELIENHDLKDYLNRRNKLWLFHVEEDFINSRNFIFTIEPDNSSNKTKGKKRDLRACKFESNNIEFIKYSISPKSKKYVNSILFSELTPIKKTSTSTNENVELSNNNQTIQNEIIKTNTKNEFTIKSNTNHKLIHISFVYNCDCVKYKRDPNQVKWDDEKNLKFIDCEKCRNKFLKHEFKIKDVAIDNGLCLIKDSRNNIVKTPIYYQKYKYLTVDFKKNICEFI